MVLAFADGLAAATVLALLLVVFPIAQFNVSMLVSLPLVVVVSKIVGLYDRDELVVTRRRSTRRPTLLQLATLYALLVWLLARRPRRRRARPRAGRAGSGSRCSALLVAARGLARRRRGASPPRALPVHRRRGPSTASRASSSDEPAQRRGRRGAAARASGTPTADAATRFASSSRAHDIDRVIIAPGADATPTRCSTSIRRRQGARRARSACCRACSRSSARRSSSTTSTGLTLLGVRALRPVALVARRSSARSTSPAPRSACSRSRR